MKKSILFICLAFLSSVAISQTVIFHENFELNSLADSVSMDSAGTNVNQWAISTTLASQGLRSDSCTISQGDTITLTTNAFSTLGNSNVMLNFSHICKIEFFDAAEIYVSNNNGTSWTKLVGANYLGSGNFGNIGNKFTSTSYTVDWLPANNNAIPTNSWWKAEQFDISSIAGNSAQVKIRFQLTDMNNTGSAGNYGWLIDDIVVLGSFSELIPPTIVDNSAIPDTIFSTGPYTITADITDASGIDTAYIIYTVNSINPDTIPMINTTGNTYEAIIPSFTYNNTICYYIEAVDASLANNVGKQPSIGCTSFHIQQGPAIVTIGTGTITNSTTGYPAPYGNYYWGAKHQMLITAAELQAAGMGGGQILSLGFDVSTVNTCPGLNNFTIKMGNTSLTAMPSTYVSGLTQVYTNTSYQPVVGWNTHTFQTSFTWNGSSNIIIETCFNNSSYLQNASMKQSATSYSSTLWYRADNSNVCGNSSGTLASQRPNMQIGMAVTNFSYDAGVSNIIQPNGTVLANQNHPIEVEVKNYGVDTLTKATVKWSLDGVTQTPAYTWTGTLYQAMAAPSVVIDSVSMQPGAHTLKVWAESPNDSTDQNHYNDTSTVNLYACSTILNGTYTIGGASADFPTFSDAFTALNNCGINGPVVFNVNSGTYNEQLYIPTINGVSSTNTVTFQSVTGINSDVILTYAATATGDNFVIRLDGASYFKFKNITIRATGTSYAYGVEMTNGANHNVIDGCVIKSFLTTSSNGRALVIYGGSLNEYNTVKNCEISGGYYAVYIYGTSSSVLAQGNIFENNEVHDFYYYGVMAYYQDGIQIIGNYIHSPLNTYCYGIYSYYLYNGFNVSKNKIILDASSYSYGLRIYYCNYNNTTAADGLVSNNFVSITQGSGTNYGLYAYYSNNTNFLYNSINITSGSTSSRSLYQYHTTSGVGMEFKNNNFVCTSGGYAAYFNTPAAIVTSDYNNFYGTGTYLAYWGGNRANLSALQTASGKDSNSVSVNPQFLSPSDLHSSSVGLDQMAFPDSLVLTDIDGQPRDSLTPDIGADEFILLPEDAGIFALVSPIGPCPGDTSDVIVSLRNFGTDTIFTAVINWAINDTLQTSVNYNDTLLAGQSININLGQYIFQSGINYKFESWSSNPNGPPDGNPSNDSLEIYPLKTSFPSGTYTIGGATADYSTFGAAINDLAANGICGPVVFNVNTGIYTEQFTIPDIIGTSVINTITFQSATGNPQDVVIQYAAVSTGDNFVIKLNNAKYVTFKKLTIKATGTSYAYGVHITNGSHHNILDGNIIISNLTTSSNGRPVVLYSGGPNSYNTIKNNIIEGGYYGMYIYGPSSTSWDVGNVILNNEIKNFYYYAMMVYYQDGVTVRDNYIHDQINTTCYGIYTYYIYNGYDISNNTINLNASSYSYGMRVYYANYNNTTTAWGLVSNNMISITGGTSTNYGIYAYYSDRTRYIYNTVNITSGSNSSRSLYQYNLTTHNVIFKNNNWVNTGGGYAVYMNTPTAINYSDYNNFYTTGTYLAYWSGNRTNLSALQLASGKEAHSVSLNPQFLSSTDLHCNAVGLDHAALADSLVLADIDGQPRDSLTPDIGADEFILLPDDAGIFALVSPSGPCPGDTSDIIVTLRNFGTDTLFTAIINWAVNDTLQTSVNFNDTLLVGQTTNILIGQYVFLQGINYKFESWSSNPNGPTDGNPSNDTISVYPLKTALPSGTYTIGGVTADYQNFSSAISDLNTFGVCGPVVFNIDSGLYIEQIQLGNIIGTSNINTITFQGTSGDSTDVVIQYSATSTANNGVVLLDGAKYITFKHVTILASGTSYSYGVNMTNGAEYNSVENCVITSNLTTSSNGRAVVIYGGANNQYNTIKNNVITGGYYSMYIYGTSTTSRARYNRIEGNDISGFYYYGMMLYYQDTIQVTDNYIHDGINTTLYGIYTYYVFDGFRIERNKVILTPSSYAYGIRIYYCNYYSYITSSTAEGIVANNFISISTGTSTNYGFYNYYSNNVKYYYNSVNLSSGSTSSRALYQYNTSSNTYKEDYINNIFSCSSGGYAAYFNTPTGIANLDYNDYYTTGTYLAYWSGNRTDLAALKTASGKDVHSISADPLFFTATDLHTTSSYLDGEGTPVASITVDIDYDVRDTLYPDIGADEFLPPPFEAGVVGISSPIDGCGLDTVFVTIDIENSGYDTISGNLNASYQIVGDTTIVTEAITNTILPGDTLTFTFATFADITTSVDSNFCFNTWINLTGDPILYNDSASICAFNGVIAPAPIAFGDTILYGDSATLTAVSPNNLFWYPSLTSTTEIDTGATFITPPLFDTTTYYVAAKVGVANALYTLGTGTTVNSGSTYPTPYGNWYWGNKDQYLILASELNTLGIVAGDIFSVAFDVSAVNSCPVLQNFEISLGHTTQSSLSSWVSNLTTVLSIPSGYQPTAGWNTHQFTTPFNWDGSSNLIIQICSNNSSYLSNGNASVNQTSTAFNSSLNVHADQAGVCSQTSATTYSQRPNMQLFAGGSGGCPSDYIPVTAIVTGIPAGDLEVIDIQTAEGCGLDTNEALTIAVYNHGWGIINGGYSARFKVDNNSWSSPETIPDTIGPNDTIWYTFNAGANLLALSDTLFNITAAVTLTGDPYQPNDTLTKDSIESLYTPSNPIFTSPILITYGNTANLTVTSLDSIYWFANFADSAEIATGNTYITPPLYDTTTYWVQAGSQYGGSGANIAPLAVASASTCNTGPCSTLNDLNLGVCGTQSMWIATSSPPSSTPGVEYMDFTWSSPKVMDKMTIHHAQDNARFLTGATMQKWVGGNWVTFHTFSNLPMQCINTFTFPIVVTSKLRLTAFQMTGTGQTSNPNFREIEIFEASLAGCTSDRLPFVVNTTAPPPIDAGVLSIDSPLSSSPSGVPTPITVRIKNFGTDTLQSVNITYAFNGMVKSTYSWTGNILFGDTSAPITIYTDTFPGGMHNMCVWTSLANGTNQGVNANDTLCMSFNACLNGTYTVGDTLSDFATIADALTAIDSAGICGNVTFRIKPGTYNMQLSFDAITGLNSSNTLTFESFTGDSTDVIFQYSATSSTDNYVIRFNGAKYITFRKVTIRATGSSYAYGVYMTNGAEYNTIENCVIKSMLTTSSNGRAVVLYSGAANQYNTIKNNKIEGGYYAMYIYGPSTSVRAKYNIIEGNDISGFYYYGMMLYYQDSIDVNENYIHDGINTYQYGIYTYYVFNGFRIERNKVILSPSNYAYGIRIYYCNYYSYITANTAPGLVANNFISITSGTGTNYGFYNYYSNKVNYYYNSVNISGGTTSSRTLYQYNTSSNTFGETYLNNIFNNTSGGYAAYFNTPTSVPTLDYNNYYTTGSYLAYWSGNRTNLAAFQSASSKESHGKSVNPAFVSAFDLHTNSFDLSGAAYPVTDVTVDIDGEARNPSTPDIGADEYTPAAVDAGAISIDYPVSPAIAGSTPVHLTFRNFGIDTLTSVTVNWKVNGVSQTPYSWTGTKLTGQTVDSVLLGNYTFTPGAAHIKAWTTNPNNTLDGFNYNDTTEVTLIVCAGFLHGTYTIGGSSADFPDFTSAVQALNYCGVDSTVVFNVNPGTYNEQVYIGTVSGASSVNTITFQGVTGDSSDVVIQYNAAGTTDNGVVLLDGAKHITFRHVSIIAGGTSYAYSVHMTNGAQFNSIENCIIKSNLTTSSNGRAVVMYTGTNNQYNKIKNNRIEGGYYALYIYGASTSNRAKHNIIEGNDISGFYYYGMMLYYQDSIEVVENYIHDGINTYQYGIYTYYVFDGFRIERNKIIMSASNYSYAMRIYYCNYYSYINASTAPGTVANNFISVTTGTGTSYGIYAYYSNKVNYYYNSVNIEGNGASSRALYQYNTTSNTFGQSFVNNIFSCTSGGYAAYYNTPTVVSTVDHNDYYTNGSNFVYWSGNMSNLAALQAMSGKDSNSVSVDPVFISNTNLHVNSPILNAGATPITGITTDIDGQPRDPNYPDIGADEFTPTARDIGPLMFVQPTQNYSPVGASKTIEITVRNFGMDTINSFSLGYIIGTANPVVSNWSGTLLPGGQFNYQFTTQFTAPAGSVLIKAYTDLVNDGDSLNDTISMIYTGVPIIPVAWSDNFDMPPYYWVSSDGNMSWEHGVPQGSTINSAHSAPNVWATKLSSQYQSNCNDNLYSPFFDFSNAQGATLKFWHWVKVASNDGGNIQYTTNGGVNWATLGYISDPLASNWYNTNIGGTHCFGSSTTSGWHLSTYDLSQFNNYSTPIQFRFHFISNASGGDDGWAIDDFAITLPKIPFDGGVSSIDSPVSTSIIGSSVTVTVTLKNYGYDTLTNIPVRYSLNNGTPVTGTYTGTLLPDSSVSYSFSTSFTSPSTVYSINTWTSVTGDTRPQNDSSYTIISPVPAQFDAGVISIINPVDTTWTLHDYNIIVKIASFGTDTIYSMDVKYDVNGINPVTETFNGVINPFDTIVYTFNTQLHSSIGMYQLCSRTALTNDADQSNDAKCVALIGFPGGINDVSESGLALWQNIPNPANDITTIKYLVPQEGQLVFELRNVLGQTITRFEKNVVRGEHQLELDIHDLPSGVYYYSIDFDEERLVKKMVINK